MGASAACCKFTSSSHQVNEEVRGRKSNATARVKVPYPTATAGHPTQPRASAPGIPEEQNLMRERLAVLAGAVLLGLAATAAPAGADVTTDMSKGGPTFSSGDNSLTIGGMLQFR